MAEQPSTNQALAEELGRLMNSLEAAGKSVFARDDEDLLQSIVDAAARIFWAAAASIALVDEAQQILVFRVAYGAGKERVLGLSVPIDHGLAGYVAMTGQPISVRDVQQDARFNQDFASSTGYVPRSILATPLLVNDRVIGVMEVLDKINAPSFGVQDMELLGIFARQAAIAINQSQQNDRLSKALIGGLRRLVNPEESPTLTHTLDAIEQAGPDKNLLAIADHLNALNQMGEAEQQMCLELLKAFGAYAQARRAMY